MRYQLSTHVLLQITTTSITRSRLHDALCIFHMFRCVLHSSTCVSRPFSCPHVHVHLRNAASRSVSRGFNSQYLWLQHENNQLARNLYSIGPSHVHALTQKMKREATGTRAEARAAWRRWCKQLAFLLAAAILSSADVLYM